MAPDNRDDEAHGRRSRRWLPTIRSAELRTGVNQSFDPDKYLQPGEAGFELAIAIRAAVIVGLLAFLALLMRRDWLAAKQRLGLPGSGP